MEIFTEGIPNEILKLPVWTETCDLEHESAIVVQEIIDLTQEGRVTANADVLRRRDRD